MAPRPIQPNVADLLNFTPVANILILDSAPPDDAETNELQ